MPHATYTVRCDTTADAAALHAALAVDLDDGLGGSKVDAVLDATDPTVIRIDIESDEVGHLRAATNSFLKRLHAAEATLRAATETGAPSHDA